MSAIDAALAARRISKLRAWWERLVCAHALTRWDQQAEPVHKTDGIEKWIEYPYRCRRCGKLFHPSSYGY